MEASIYPPTALPIGYVLTAPPARGDRLMPRNLQSWNPLNCLVCVIDEPDAAARAVADLREAGFAAADVRLADPLEVVAIDDAWHSRGLLARMAASIRTLGDEGIVAAEYLTEARRGHHALIVYAPGGERTRRAWTIVARRGAHTIHYYGRWAIRGMADEGTVAPPPEEQPRRDASMPRATANIRPRAESVPGARARHIPLAGNGA